MNKNKLYSPCYTLLVLGCTGTASCSFTASSIAFNCCTHLFASSSISSMSDVSSMQKVHLIRASSPTLTDRVITHRAMNEMTNSVAGTPNAKTNSRQVFFRSKRANTLVASFYKHNDKRTFSWL